MKKHNIQDIEPAYSFKFEKKVAATGAGKTLSLAIILPRIWCSSINLRKGDIVDLIIDKDLMAATIRVRKK